MSIASDIGQLGSMFKDSVHSPLLFTFSDLEVLFEALSYYQDHLFQSSDDPDIPSFYAFNGESYEVIIDRLISLFQNYKFQ